MSEDWKPRSVTTRGTHPDDGPLAFRPIGTRYYGTFPNRTETDEISDGRDRLLHQVGGSRTTRNNHRKERKRIHLEGNHMQIRHPIGFYIRQWTTIQQLAFQRILQRTRHTQSLLVLRSPSGQRTGGSHKSIPAQDDQDST